MEPEELPDIDVYDDDGLNVENKRKSLTEWDQVSGRIRELAFHYMKEVFDLFDFWDGRDGLIDAVKLGDLLRCCSLNPTNSVVLKNGGTKRSGEKQYNMEEYLAIVKQVVKEKDTGTFKDFMEAFKSFDREGQGYISLGEARHVLTTMGDRLTDEELEDILQSIDLQADFEGNIKYEEFIKKVLKGPPMGT